MEKILVKELAGWTGGKLLKGEASAPVTSISIDSRSLKAGALFVAIKGAKFDGHNFVEKLATAGALGAVVSRKTPGIEKLEITVLVSDTTEALKKIAAGYLKKLGKMKVAGISGSNGKTTTKDILAGILARSRKTHKARGSFNNNIGLPLTILETDSSFGALVLEYGTNHPGELAELVKVARPDAAGITNIGTAHIGNFKTRENILKEKWVLLENLKEHGVIALNADDELLAAKKDGLRNKKCLTFGTKGRADLRAENITELPAGGTVFKVAWDGAAEEVKFSLLGLHNVSNALCAAALAAGLGTGLKDIAAGLTEFKPASLHRLAVKEVNGIKIIDDAYNANPESVKGALETLKVLRAARKFIVLGEMAELGEYSREFHELIGSEAAAVRPDGLVAVGRTGAWYRSGALKTGLEACKVHLFSDNETAGVFLKKSLKNGDLVLIKGSRTAGMEKLAEKLTGE